MLLEKALLALTVAAPFVACGGLAARWFAVSSTPSELFSRRVIGAGLVASLAGSVSVAAWLLAQGAPYNHEIVFGQWFEVGWYSVPIVLDVDFVSALYSLCSAAATLLTARFSREYLHREAGFHRFFLLVGLFAGGVQVLAFAGNFDLMFAGWETIGLCSVLMIGFFHYRQAPLRGALWTFATYRACDLGFILAIIGTHEFLGSTRLAALEESHTLSAPVAAALAGLFLLAAVGKSAQVPFSGWLPRALEGPTPSSALFYGAISIHAGLYLLLRVRPLLAVSFPVVAAAVVIGCATAVYATSVARVRSDAKGILAHAALAQTGLILVEIALGWTVLALVHLVCHASLRIYQYLRAPNALHDAHAMHLPDAHHPTRAPTSKCGKAWYFASLNHFRFDEWLERLVARPLSSLARKFAGVLR